MRILKFGGTSIASLKKVYAICAHYNARQERIAVVVSALKGTTSALVAAGETAHGQHDNYIDILKQVEKQHLDNVRALIHVAKQSAIIAHIKIVFNQLEEILRGVFLLKELSKRTLDRIQSFGECLSAYLVAQYFNQEGLDVCVLDARKLIITNTNYGRASVNFEKTDINIQTYFSKCSSTPIITGFIAATENGETTTLGRGGSDYTAAIFGAALNADEIEIWTDVDGVLTADPRLVKNAFSLKNTFLPRGYGNVTPWH